MKNHETTFQLNKHQRMALFFIFVLIVSISFILNFTYRPYIYSNHINDFHIADSFPNFLGVPAVHSLGLSLSKHLKTDFAKQIISICFGVIVYECFIGFTFDYYDILASVFSGILTYIVELKMLHLDKSSEL